MSTREKIAGDIKFAFLFGVGRAILGFSLFRQSFDCSLSSGIAAFASTTAFLTTLNLLTPEDEYIDERTEKID